MLDDLRVRLQHTRWPDRENVDDWSQGIPLAYVQEVAAYWANGYDWRRREAALNRFDQFTTTIDGLDIHFVHQRSPHEGALPLLITHGWPGSIVEFHKVIEPLVDPVAFGGDAADAFHVIAPSLPGFAFSGKPTSTGLGGRADRRRMGDADGAAGLRPLCRPGRRLGVCDHDRGRCPGSGALRGDPHHAQHVGASEGTADGSPTSCRRWPASSTT